MGNRRAVEFIPAEGVTPEVLADAGQLSSLSDETPEGRSIVLLAKEKYGIRDWKIDELGVAFIPFSAQTRMSGVDLKDGRQIRKGASGAIEAYVKHQGGSFPAGVTSVEPSSTTTISVRSAGEVWAAKLSRHNLRRAARL